MANTAIYVGHSAKLSFIVREKDGKPVDLVAFGVTSMKLHLAGVTVDSDTPGSFDWTTNGTSGEVEIDLSGQTFPVGSYGARLVIYSAQYPSGVVVADGYPINIGEAIS